MDENEQSKMAFLNWPLKNEDSLKRAINNAVNSAVLYTLHAPCDFGFALFYWFQNSNAEVYLNTGNLHLWKLFTLWKPGWMYDAKFHSKQKQITSTATSAQHASNSGKGTCIGMCTDAVRQDKKNIDKNNEKLTGNCAHMMKIWCDW